MGIVNRSEDDVVVDSSLPSDALSSKQFATIVDVLSEGEIEGFPSAAAFTKGTANYNTAALKDVFLGKTPVLRASADPTNTQPTDFNFQDVEFEPRFGTNNQTFISGISNIESETNVGVKVENGTPVSRQITNSNINAVRVTIRFNGLQTFETNGDVNGASVELTIKIIQNNGTTTTPISDTVTGRTSSAYNRDYRVDLPSNLNYPITVQVARVTADATDPNRLRDEFFFSSFTEIIDEQRPYPDIAHAALRFDSQQFSSVPRRMYKVRGVKIKIPHNGTVDATNGRITYTGTFNGTLTTTKVWCSDPAWILFNLLTETRYGLGDHITEAQLDKYAFYSASVYCSELVDDGAGGQEPRFSCNTILQARQDAYEVVNSLTSVMRSISYWNAGSLTISQDRPTDPSYLFNLSNVTSAGFGYSGTSLKTRATVVSVSYFDMENQELDFETVEDVAAKNKYGVLHKKITGFGCSSRGQARRLGRFLLFEEQNSTETINFTTGISEGVVVRPGQVIEVSDPVRAGLRRGGRIKSATTTTVTVDNTDDTDLDATNNPTLSVILPDGSVESKSVTGIVGAVITIDSSTPFSSAPNANSVWILQNTTLQTTQWRVVSVTEDKDNYAIIGTAYNSAKFAFIEDGSTLPTRNVTILNELKNAPAIDSAEQFFYVENQKAKVKIILDYQAVPGVSQYRVQYRKDKGNFVTTTVTGTDFTIFDASEGEYEFRVFSLNAALEASAEPSTLIKDFAGKTAIPADMTGLTAEPINSKLIRLRWNRSTDIDVTHGGLVYIRHDSSGTDGTGTFENAVDLIEAAPGNSTEAIVPAITGEYILKFQDDGGRFSAGEASVVVNIPEVTDELLIQTRREDLDNPKFQGAKVNTAFDATTNSLNLTGAGQFDDIGVSIAGTFDDVDSLDDIGGISPSGTYDFASTLDLGAVFSLDLIRHFKTEGFFPSDLFDARPQGFPTTGTFDGTEANEVDAQLFVRTTQDDPSGSPTYTAFQNFTSGTFKARGFQFRTVLTSNDPAQDIRVFQLGYTAKLERRTEQRSNITQNAQATAYTFDSPFFTGTSALLGANSNLPSINVTAQNLASGDYFEITNVSSTGFTIDFKNSSNASIGKNFSYTAVGFGKG